MIALAKDYADKEALWKRIEAVAQALEDHRADYATLAKNTTALFDRTEALFGEEPFAKMRFSAADVQRAFEAVGYPSLGLRDKKSTEIVDWAVRFLADANQRSALAQRLLLTLPDYVAAKRYVDGWIIRHNVELTANKDASTASPFLLAMFMHGYREWERQRQTEESKLFAALGIDSEELRGMGYDTIDSWLRDMKDDPDKTAAMERFLKTHPELNAMTQAQCEAAEDAALKLLESDTARSLLLPEEEVMPWLDILEARLKAAPEGFANLSETNLSTEAIAEAFVKLLYQVGAEMAGAVFTPPRLDRFKTHLHEVRQQLSAGAAPEMLQGLHGALMAAHTQAPDTNRFLTTLCVLSLKATMESMRDQ